MSIYTRMGTPATIVSAEADSDGILWVIANVHFEDGDAEREYAINEFRATGGMREIFTDINRVEAGNPAVDAFAFSDEKGWYRIEDRHDQPNR